MQSKATTVKQYLDSLPPDRREAIEAVREVILDNLDRDYEEGIGYGMLSYHVPHRVYPPGYHCNPKLPLPFASVASQKNHMAVYLSCNYGPPGREEWFRKAWAKTGKKLDMGKSCVRFKRLEDVALEVIGEAIRRMPAADYIAYYESVVGKRAAGGRPAAQGAGQQASKQASKKASKKTANATGTRVAKKTAKQTSKTAATTSARKVTGRAGKGASQQAAKKR
jgi:hypothetical protein